MWKLFGRNLLCLLLIGCGSTNPPDFAWVKPVDLIDANWSDNDGDGNDNYPDSMLDFAFVAGQAKDWNPVCRVIVREGDFPDDKTTSDHRPIELRLTIPDQVHR